MRRAFVEALRQETGQAKLASCNVSEVSHEAAGLGGVGHGVFTYAVIEGLKGGADLSRDRFIEAQELSTYVQGAVRKLTADKQLPKFSQSGRSDFVISKVR
jgi:uncharacterized caspase-like protein